MKSISEERADQLAVFRLPTALLRSVDMFCAEQDITRSQLFRRCIAEYLDHHHLGYPVKQMPAESLNCFWEKK